MVCPGALANFLARRKRRIPRSSNTRPSTISRHRQRPFGGRSADRGDQQPADAREDRPGRKAIELWPSVRFGANWASCQFGPSDGLTGDQCLRAQESLLNGQMADLSSKYGPRHPKMLDLQAQKETWIPRSQKKCSGSSIRQKRRRGLAGHEVLLQQSLHQLESKGAGQNQAEVQLTALQSAATSTRAMYEAFLGRLNQTQGQEGIETPDARVISNAETPSSPSFPNKTFSIGVSIPAGLLLGLLFAFRGGAHDLGFRTTTQLEALLGVRFFRPFPRFPVPTRPKSMSPTW